MRHFVLSNKFFYAGVNSVLVLFVDPAYKLMYVHVCTCR